ncbi:MAG: class I SAM-dependent methyltransferase [Acidimicrobiaceae bacterium]
MTSGEPIDEIQQIINRQDQFVRAIFSGRRRNMQPEFEKVELRPVRIQETIRLQMTTVDVSKSKTTNMEFGDFDALGLLESGFANCLVESTELTLTLRFTKKGSPLIHRSRRTLSQVTSHDRQKSRLLDPSSDFLQRIGISDQNGSIQKSKRDKYLQIEEFLRILMPTLRDEIAAGRLHKPTIQEPLKIFDHGCGNAYLTFAVHYFLMDQDIPNLITGIDQRDDSRERNFKIATDLGLNDSVRFRAEKIAKLGKEKIDLAIALHACDTATDDAIAWSINNKAQIMLVSPCCHHNLQSQIFNVAEPWSIVTKNGILKERLGDILTDSLRAQILKLHGYRTDIVEFVGDEHTPRNLLIRSVLTRSVIEGDEKAKYNDLLKIWSVKPYLAEILNFQ